MPPLVRQAATDAPIFKSTGNAPQANSPDTLQPRPGKQQTTPFCLLSAAGNHHQPPLRPISPPRECRHPFGPKWCSGTNLNTISTPHATSPLSQRLANPNLSACHANPCPGDNQPPPQVPTFPLQTYQRPPPKASLPLPHQIPTFSFGSPPPIIPSPPNTPLNTPPRTSTRPSTSPPTNLPAKTPSRKKKNAPFGAFFSSLERPWLRRHSDQPESGGTGTSGRSGLPHRQASGRRAQD